MSSKTSGSGKKKGNARMRDAPDGTTSPSMQPNAMDIEGDDPMPEEPDDVVVGKKRAMGKAAKAAKGKRAQDKDGAATQSSGAKKDKDKTKKRQKGGKEADEEGDEASELRATAGAAPKSKARKRSPALAADAGAEPDNEQTEKAPKEPPTDEQKKDMRIRARVSGLRKHAAKTGMSSRAIVKNRKYDAARGVDALANCLSVHDMARMMRWTMETPEAAGYGEAESMIRVENHGNKLPPGAARQALGHVEPIFKWAIEAATNATIQKGAVSVAPMAMFQTLRPYVAATVLSHTTLPQGLIRELRTLGVVAPIADNGKDDVKKYRERWRENDAKHLEVEVQVGAKVLEALKRKRGDSSA